MIRFINVQQISSQSDSVWKRNVWKRPRNHRFLTFTHEIYIIATKTSNFKSSLNESICIHQNVLKIRFEQRSANTLFNISFQSSFIVQLMLASSILLKGATCMFACLVKHGRKYFDTSTRYQPRILPVENHYGSTPIFPFDNIFDNMFNKPVNTIILSNKKICRLLQFRSIFIL